MSEVINIMQPAQLTFIFLLILSIINLLLALKSRIPLVNFVVAVFTIGMAATTIGTELMFQGYIQMFTMICAVLALVMGIKEYRSN